MAVPTPHILGALRLPELYRQVCLYAGVPLPPAPADAARFVLRTGPEPPGLFMVLLEEAFLGEEAERPVYPPADSPDFGTLGPGEVLVQPGYDSPCPFARELREAVRSPGGSVLLFAIERRDAEGRLLGVTWAAVPEEEPPPEAEWKAAVLREDQKPTWK